VDLLCFTVVVVVPPPSAVAVALEELVEVVLAPIIIQVVHQLEPVAQLILAVAVEVV
jgi:hypothetical protein